MSSCAAKIAVAHDFAIVEDPMSANFETFLRFWIAENIRPPDGFEPGALDDIVHSRAKELEAAATSAGYYGELDEGASLWQRRGFCTRQIQAGR